MQPFINPYLFQNPYSMQCGNPTLQSTQNSYNPLTQPIGINGKYVNDFNEITASDVPMNGQPSLFIRNDRSEIQLREWSPNGQIISTQFVPCITQEQPSTQPAFDVNAVIEPIFERLSQLEDKLDKLSKPATVKAKKEGEQA